MTIRDLILRWRADAELLRGYGATEAAAAAERHAEQLAEAVQIAADQPLTMTEAVRESGYSERRLREMIADGELPNAGQRGRPRIRRADLPRKASRKDSGFDAAAEALSIRRAG